MQVETQDEKKVHHTPGPWGINSAKGVSSNHCFFSVIPQTEPYRGSVANVMDAVNIDGISIAESEANARLIAAAPDLLAACKAALDFLGSDAANPDIGDVIRAAIEKAEAVK